jgi:hypothetical protein
LLADLLACTRIYRRLTLPLVAASDSENEMDLAVDILLENVRRWEAGEPLASEVNVTKGY